MVLTVLIYTIMQIDGTVFVVFDAIYVWCFMFCLWCFLCFSVNQPGAIYLHTSAHMYIALFKKMWELGLVRRGLHSRVNSCCKHSLEGTCIVFSKPFGTTHIERENDSRLS